MSPVLRRRWSASAVGGLGFALALAAFVRLGLLWSVDLQGAFGPDAPGAITAAMLDPLGHPYPLHPIAIGLLVPFCGGDPVQAALMVSLLSGFAVVGACWSMGRLLAGDYGGQAAGAVAATAPLLSYTSLLKGGDALAIALAAWGLAVTWEGARRSESDEMAAARRLVLGPALLGLSAWAKPIALPLGLCLFVVLVVCHRSAWMWLCCGMLAGLVLASPMLAPLVQPIPELGLLANWWQPGPPALLSDWLELPAKGFGALVQIEIVAPWTMGFALFLLGVLGACTRGVCKHERLVLFVLGGLALLGTGALLGDRLQARYLAAATVPWTVLTGVALVPRRLRAPGATLLRRRWFDTLALSVVLTLFLISSMRIWEGIGLMRAQEEGTGAVRGFLVADPELALLPNLEMADSTICGSLELDRLTTRIVEEAPLGAVVALVPLRDGRGWHMIGPLRWQRPDIEVVELEGNCCPNPDRCGPRLLHALSTTGGVIVGPLETEGRCETGATDMFYEPLASAVDTLLLERDLWFGSRWVTKIEDVPAHGRHVCERIGGRRPVAPARTR